MEKIMIKKHKHDTSSFKAKVALAALERGQTTSERAARHPIHPTMISIWRKELLDNTFELFERKKSKRVQIHQDEVDTLYRPIGQFTVERDFLARRLNH
ncbi:hypothetical protein N9V90_01445 [Endozoicomonas sp.]|nr:hypothetical protein [Endozoicomonas sp.]